MMLGVHDLEQISKALPGRKTELVGGKVIVMSPSDHRSGLVAARFAMLLGPYVYEHRLGTVGGADTGYVLPNGDVRGPDVSFTSYERLPRSPRTFASAVPEFVAEIRSSADTRREVREKLRTFLDAGVLVGVYVDPDARELIVMRRARADERLGDGDVLRIPELFSDWEMPVHALWPPDAPEGT